MSLLTITLIPTGVRADPDPGASLSAGQGHSHPGAVGVVVPISLISDPGAEVAAINFDLSYDSSQLTFQQVSEGDAALAADKIVASSSPSDGVIRVIVYGLNQTAIGDGVIVNVHFDIPLSAAQGLTPLTFSQEVAAAPDASSVPLTTTPGSIEISGEPTTFADVPRTYWAYDEIEALYQAGYTAGCAVDPLRYCPDETMTREESAVYIVRGVHTTDFAPPQPTIQVFADVALDRWSADWIDQLWNDGYTAGCGTDPLIYCPERKHDHAEATVFYLRMMYGVDYLPPDPTGIFVDVPLDHWAAGWIEAAYNAGLIPACETEPELKFCPDKELSRAMSAYMMVQAKDLPLP